LVFLVQYKVHPVNTELQWKKSFSSTANETGVCQNKNGCTLTLVDSDILNKNDVP